MKYQNGFFAPAIGVVLTVAGVTTGEVIKSANGYQDEPIQVNASEYVYEQDTQEVEALFDYMIND